jgi:hypothetical protein
MTFRLDVTEAAQPAAELFWPNVAGVGVEVGVVVVAEVFEYIEGLLPGGASGLVMTGCMVGIAEVSESDRLAIAIGEFRLKGQFLLVVIDGLIILAKSMVS